MGILNGLRSRFQPAAGARPGPAAGAREPTPARPQFVWRMLSTPSGTHLEFLDRDYVPVLLLDLITAEPRRVLDVGCYCGATGESIKQRWPGAKVTGIEPLTEAAREAGKRIDRVINKTVEAAFEDAGFAPGSFDAILFADVLEHLYNPWAALERARDLLADDGFVFASIPNVRNLGLIEKLVNGHWTYEGSGLLDITHIRFFTLAEAHDLFAQTGFRVVQVSHGVDPALAPLWNVETENDAADVQLGTLVIKAVSRADRQELATRRFYIKAEKAPQ